MSTPNPTHNRRPPRVWTLPAEEVVRHQKRVLRFVNAYLRVQKQDLLVTDGRSLMTWGEIREHVKQAIALRMERPKSGVKAG